MSHQTPQDAVRLAQILSERERQRHLYSTTHDRGHTGAEWVAILALYLGKVAAGELGAGPAEYEKRLVQLGALVLAALEAEQSRNGH